MALLLPAARGLKPEQAVRVSTGDGSLDEAAAEDCAVVEASRLTRSSAYWPTPTARSSASLARKHGLMMPCDSDSWRLERGAKVTA